MRVEELTARALKHGDLDRYQLALAVSKRAKQLQNGSQSKLNVDVKKVKATDLALMEIAEGLITVSGFVDKE